MRYLFAPLLVALSFLTILPVGLRNPADAEVSRSRGWYPLVGLLYGLLLAGLLALYQLVAVFPPYTLLSAALMVVVLGVVNRFLHLDGLMDFCDAMWGGHTVERRLEIMRDSRVGSFGVAGGFCVLLVKFAAVSTLMFSGWMLPALLLFPMVSRWTMTMLLTVFPYGRQEGIGSAFASGRRPWLATGLAFLTILAAAWLMLGIVGLSVLVAVSLLALLLGLWAARRLGGGLTGDCYGAVNEIMEAVSLTFFVMWIHYDYASSGFIQVGYGGGIAFPWLLWSQPEGGWFSYGGG